jgi:CBS-domain-containing membrane protein
MTYAALPTFRFPEGTCIPQAQPALRASVTMDSPAIEVMTDLTMVSAATILPQLSLAQAEKQMIQQGVRMLFVASEMPCIDGIVTVSDMHGPDALQLVQQRQIRHGDLRVSDVMTPLQSLDAIEYASLLRATVGQVVATLKQFGRHHLLVIEDATAKSPARVRGIVSDSQVQRQLGTPLHLTTIATTFAEIERALL